MTPQAVSQVLSTGVSLETGMFFVQLFGMLVGWLWVTLALMLQYGRREEYPWTFPLAFCTIGVGLILISNRVLIPMYPTSLFLTLLGYALVAAVGVVATMWITYVFPTRYAVVQDPDEQLPP